MFQVVVSLKKSFARKEFDKNASDRPNVTRIGPSQTLPDNSHQLFATLTLLSQ